MEIEKTYNPKNFEKQINQKWNDLKIFAGDEHSSKPAFSVLLPPPNITGELHIGHALMVTMQDIMVRYKKMQGFETMWCPGTDHAAIATEAKVTTHLAKQGINKYDLTREEFEQHMQQWYAKYGGYIIEQIKGMGAGCDWDRLCFTRDEKRNRAVSQAFVDLWEKGLIYRAERLTNWCPHCQTAISDIETVYEEKQSKLYHLRYYVENSQDYLVVATTRPETLFGDLAVAVNPNDSRFAKFVGKKVVLPLCNRAIPVIADEYVDMEFGTGALKITPSHDINDYNVGKKHGLGLLSVIEKDGTLNSHCGEYQGLKGMDARLKVVEGLKNAGLLEKEQDYVNKVGTCERCHTTIESLVSEQWFVSMKGMAQSVLNDLNADKINIYPTKFKKDLSNWLENIQDWCISRQLWSGHRIPVYTCSNCGNVYASLEKCNCAKCGSDKITQDPDVLDTWFSSSLWPLSTLDFDRQNDSYKKFYPYGLLVTAYDIIFFWVARMLFMGKHFSGQIPFKDIMMIGLVRDAQGRKLSKNLGNGVDPQKVIDEFGADALRMALVYNVALGGDSKFSDDKIDFARRFSNKIWNASRFVQMNIDCEILPIEKCNLSLADKWILFELNKTVTTVTHLIDRFDVGIALAEIYEFAWAKFCDYYIEFSKPYMSGYEHKQSTVSVLVYVLNAILKMLHPFIPFITEEIYCSLNPSEKSILYSSYPQPSSQFAEFENIASEMDSIMDLTRQIRNIRTQFKVETKKIIDVEILQKISCQNPQENFLYLETLTNSHITEVQSDNTSDDLIVLTTPYYTAFITRSSIIDVESERKRLVTEQEKLQKEYDKLTSILSNENFVSHAPAQVLEKYKTNLADLTSKLDQIKTSLENLN